MQEASESCQKQGDGSLLESQKKFRPANTLTLLCVTFPSPLQTSEAQDDKSMLI